jgi:hypothetical protein
MCLQLEYTTPSVQTPGLIIPTRIKKSEVFVAPSSVRFTDAQVLARQAGFKYVIRERYNYVYSVTGGYDAKRICLVSELEADSVKRSEVYTARDKDSTIQDFANAKCSGKKYVQFWMSVYDLNDAWVCYTSELEDDTPLPTPPPYDAFAGYELSSLMACIRVRVVGLSENDGDECQIQRDLARIEKISEYINANFTRKPTEAHA